jgi:hypothetical protein
MMKNKNILFASAQILLAISIILNHFIRESGPVSFIIGFCTGFSIVLNIAALIHYRKGVKQEQ